MLCMSGRLVHRPGLRRAWLARPTGSRGRPGPRTRPNSRARTLHIEETRRRRKREACDRRAKPRAGAQGDAKQQGDAGALESESPWRNLTRAKESQPQLMIRMCARWSLIPTRRPTRMEQMKVRSYVMATIMSIYDSSADKRSSTADRATLGRGFQMALVVCTWGCKA